MLVEGHLDALGSSHLTGELLPDQIEQVWWLSWTAFALSHGHNVFSAQWQNYPAGQNFGVNGSMLSLGIFFLPITKLLGPIVSWNVALRLALAASATSMCLVLRRWTTWWPAAFVGGLLYGFSAYAILFSSDLLFLTFVPLPPVVFLVLHEILVRQQWRPGRAGGLLGVLCALQFFIFPEILASTAVMGAIAVAVFLLVSRHDLVKRRRYALTAFAYSIGVGGLLLILPVFYTLAGPQRIKGGPISPTALMRYPSDVLGAIVPSSEWLSTNGLMELANTRFPYATALYLGLPLIGVLVSFAVFFRKRRAVLFAGLMVLIAFILSLGPRLRVGGHETPIRLPFVALEHLPLLESLTPVRFSLYTALFGAAMFAIGLDEFSQRLRRSCTTSWLTPRWRIVSAAGLSAAIAAAVAIPLIPRHTQPVSETDVPSFFTSTAVDAIPQDSVVLAYPYPDMSGPSPFYQPTHDIMLDQAVAGMRFKLIGGYGWFPSPEGVHGITSPAVLKPTSVQTLFDSAFYGKAPPPKARTAADLRVFLRKFDVQSVISLPQGTNPGLVFEYVTAAIGCPVDSGGVTVWLNVKRRLHGAQGGGGNLSADTCEALPKLVTTTMLAPTNGATVSGTKVLDSVVMDYFKVTKVEYYLTGGSEHSALVGTGSLSRFGWIALWNTATVPNGTYRLQSTAFDTNGRKGHGAGITITIKN